MILKVKRVRKEDRAIADFIVNNLVEKTDETSSAGNLDALLNDNGVYLLAAIIDNEIIGYALAYRFPSLYGPKYLAYLYDIEVLEAHRRKGAGRMLIETLIDLLKTDGVEELWLGTGTDNPEGQALYTSTGAIKSQETFNDFTYKL